MRAMLPLREFNFFGRFNVTVRTPNWLPNMTSSGSSPGSSLMSTADANYRGLRSVSCRHPNLLRQEKRTFLEALPAMAGALIFARRGMLTGLAASRLQDVWRSIGGGVVVSWWEVCDRTMLSFGAGWNGRPRLCKGRGSGSGLLVLTVRDWREEEVVRGVRVAIGMVLLLAV